MLEYNKKLAFKFSLLLPEDFFSILINHHPKPKYSECVCRGSSISDWPDFDFNVNAKAKTKLVS